MNNAVLDMSVQISAQVPAFSSFMYICRSRIAESYGNSMFNFLKNCYAFFPQWLCHFTFSPVIHKGSSFSISSPTLVVFCFCFVIFFLFIGCAGFLFLPTGLSLVAESGGYSLVAVCGLLIVVASPAAECGLVGTWASVVAAPGL